MTDFIHDICNRTCHLNKWPTWWIKSILIVLPRKRNLTECSDYRAVNLIGHASKRMLRIVLTRLSHNYAQTNKLASEKAEILQRKSNLRTICVKRATPETRLAQLDWLQKGFRKSLATNTLKDLEKAQHRPQSCVSHWITWLEKRQAGRHTPRPNHSRGEIRKPSVCLRSCSSCFRKKYDQANAQEGFAASLSVRGRRLSNLKS